MNAGGGDDHPWIVSPTERPEQLVREQVRREVVDDERLLDSQAGELGGTAFSAGESRVIDEDGGIVHLCLVGEVTNGFACCHT
ncbi:hypothetical protein ACFQL7_24805 [Halocatena marina]|uniref:Uncharacterized protein n=1 Tax=Halocatena marina TaxID=2934937 RepID=A0ABD5YU15_9EURY